MKILPFKNINPNLSIFFFIKKKLFMIIVKIFITVIKLNKVISKTEVNLFIISSF